MKVGSGSGLSGIGQRLPGRIAMGQVRAETKVPLIAVKGQNLPPVHNNNKQPTSDMLVASK